jgi:transcriptional regulator with XRE-family HTH domain
LTQEELALRIGVSNSEISHYESGRRDPKVGSVQRLADGLKTPCWAIWAMIDEIEARERSQSSGTDLSADAADREELHRQVRWDLLVALELEGVVSAAAADRAQVGSEVEDL